MRHDKEAFTAETLEAFRIGKLVGDHIRILAFTSYARALPHGVDAVKKAVDPFTGCFISRIPVTVSCLHMALTVAGMFAADSPKSRQDGHDLVRVGSKRLGEAMKDLLDLDKVKEKLKREREGWDLYYDVLDALEKGLEEGDGFAESLREKTQELVEGWKI